MNPTSENAAYATHTVKKIDKAKDINSKAETEGKKGVQRRDEGLE